MRYQKTNERRAVILMVVLSLLTLFALVGITFVLYADAEAASARVSREAETAQRADVPPEQALAFFLGQFIYGVNDDSTGVGSGLRGHDLARTMYGNFYLGGAATFNNPTISMNDTTGLTQGATVTVISNANPNNYIASTITNLTANTSITLAQNWPYPTTPTANGVLIKVAVNNDAFNGIGRLHATAPNPAIWSNAQAQDDYNFVNYTWFANDTFLHDPERFGIRTSPFVAQTNPYYGGNAPYTYPDLNNYFLAAVTANGTVLAPSFHRTYAGAMPNLNPPFPGFGSLDPSNPYWYGTPTNPPPGWQPTWPSPATLKYMTLRPRPADHQGFPAPEDSGGDVKNLVWAPGGNDSIWIDLGAPVMTAPDGTQYKMLFAPLIIDLDGRINLNTAGNILAYSVAMNSPTSWQNASAAHTSNQGWVPSEVNLSKVLYADSQTGAPYGQWQQTTAPTPSEPPEWMRLFTGATFAVPTPPNYLPGLWLNNPLTLPQGIAQVAAPGVNGKYLQTPTPATNASSPAWTPTTTASNANIFLGGTAIPAPYGTYPHFYAPVDFNGMNEASTTQPYTASTQLAPPTTGTTAYNWYATYPTNAYQNGGITEDTNHPLLFNLLQSPLTSSIGTRMFRPSDMETLLRPSQSAFPSGQGPADANASAMLSDLVRLCPNNFGPLQTNMRYRNLVTTLSWDLGVPGVSPYWWYGMPATSNYSSSSNNGNGFMLAPFGQAVPFPTGTTPPNWPSQSSTITTAPSEFSYFWRAASASTSPYLPAANPTAPLSPASLTNLTWTWNAGQWSLTNATSNAGAYSTPGARIRLNRPLPPYPHMGLGVAPPYTGQPTNTTAGYGYAYDLTNATVANQYQAALGARQALANDIYRRLLAITGVPAPAGGNATPTPTDLQPRRWLAQLAVNIVDYIDEDDISTPFNFYTTADGLPPASIGALQGNDDNGTSNPTNPTPTGQNPTYWVFGTELPKVVLNEALAEATNPNPAAAVASDTVNVWVELLNTMQTGIGTNTQAQDNARVPFYISPPPGSTAGITGYSPYIITLAQGLMAIAPTAGATLPDSSANVLGKANNLTNTSSSPLPKNTSVQEFGAGSVVNLMGGGPQPANSNSATVNVGIDPLGSMSNATPAAALSQFFLIGPGASAAPLATVGAPYKDPYVLAGANPGVPANTPVYRSPNLQYSPNWTAVSTTDERTTGLTVMLRRLANPYLPFNGNPSITVNGTVIPNPAYNPYVTVDYVQNVPIQSNTTPPAGAAYCSRGKTQPYAALTLLATANQAPSGSTTTATSPVANQIANASPPPAGAYPLQGTAPPTCYTTFGATNYPAPQTRNVYDWLVHLDRPPISPMELLHVSAFQPHQLTQQFILGDNNVATNKFGHYAPWLDAPPAGTTLANLACPWWFDSTLTGGVTATSQSHRLYRLFEFLECGDRTTGANGLGRIPGKVNINTVWDPEILQAIIDDNPSIGGTSNLSQYPPSGNDRIASMFANLIQSRSPNAKYNSGTYTGTVGAVNMGTSVMGGTSVDDRPFLPFGVGLYSSGAGTQYPNGISVTSDTLLRMNPNSTPTANTLLLFQNPGVTGGANPIAADSSSTHPYLQTQMLNKLFNNVTTRSNTFAIFLTVGFFQVMNANAAPPTLGPEIGRAEGRQIRHRMFAIVDRTNLAALSTNATSTSSATGPTLTNPTGQATIAVNLTTTTGINANTGAAWTLQAGMQLVADPGTINEETVVVQAVAGPSPPGQPNVTITASFTKAHGGGFQLIQRGNPGPWSAFPTPYDPRGDPLVVRYFSIID